MSLERITQRCGLCKNPENPVVAVRRLNGQYMALCSDCLETVKIVQQKKKNARSRQKNMEKALAAGREYVPSLKYRDMALWM